MFFSRNDSKRNANRRYKKTPQVFVENSAKQKKNAFTNVPIFILKKNKQNKQKSNSDLFKKSFHRAETCYVMQRNPSGMEKNSVKLGKRDWNKNSNSSGQSTIPIWIEKRKEKNSVFEPIISVLTSLGTRTKPLKKKKDKKKDGKNKRATQRVHSTPLNWFHKASSLAYGRVRVDENNNSKKNETKTQSRPQRTTAPVHVRWRQQQNERPKRNWRVDGVDHVRPTAESNK